MSGLDNIIKQRIENDDRAKQKVGTLPVKDRYFLCHCEKCGWLGSSEECRESINHMYGDGDYYCPACGANGPEEMGSAEATFNAMLAAAPQVVATGWIDPNDKTQKRFLPHIGEPVLFCCDGVTYYGVHTGGSFKTGQGITARNFNTWECRWMYPPAAAQKGGA